MVEDKPVRVNEDTELSVPLRNLITIVIAVAMAVWGYFTAIERINIIENSMARSQMEQMLNTEFRIKWPRGEMGSLPADARQDMAIEALNSKLSDIRGLDKEAEVLRMRVAALEEFAQRPSRSSEHIKQVEIKVEHLKEELFRLRDSR
tara:strand:+ start:1047 stop:1490 length:444 start_codon:yes stop_codon:yes gene_type:complete